MITERGVAEVYVALRTFVGITPSCYKKAITARLAIVSYRGFLMTWKNMRDENIFKAYLDGEDVDQELETLIRRITPLIMNILRRTIVLQNKPADKYTLEDLSQETWRKAFKAKNYRPNAPFRSWMAIIAKNTALDWLKRERRTSIVPSMRKGEVGENEDDTMYMGGLDVGGSEQAEGMAKAYVFLTDYRDCIKRLPKKYEKSFIFTMLQWTQREIATELGFSLGQANKIIQKGLLMIRGCLHEKGWETMPDLSALYEGGILYQ